MNLRDELLFLYEQLDTYRKRRYQLALWWFLFLVTLVIGPLVMLRLLRVIGLAAILIVLAISFLVLLVRTLRNERIARDLELHVRELKLRIMIPDDASEKPKRRENDETVYGIGDDGELIMIKGWDNSADYHNGNHA